VARLTVIPYVSARAATSSGSVLSGRCSRSVRTASTPLASKLRVTAVLLRLRSDVARRAAARDEAIDGGDPDAEPVGDLLPGALLAEPGRDDAVTQIHRECRGHARIRSRRIAAHKTPIKLQKLRYQA
jgi:hypothetical protein